MLWEFVLNISLAPMVGPVLTVEGSASFLLLGEDAGDLLLLGEEVGDLLLAFVVGQAANATTLTFKAREVGSAVDGDDDSRVPVEHSFRNRRNGGLVNGFCVIDFGLR